MLKVYKLSLNHNVYAFQLCDKLAKLEKKKLRGGKVEPSPSVGDNSDAVREPQCDNIAPGPSVGDNVQPQRAKVGPGPSQSTLVEYSDSEEVRLTP